MATVWLKLENSIQLLLSVKLHPRTPLIEVGVVDLSAINNVYTSEFKYDTYDDAKAIYNKICDQIANGSPIIEL